MPEAAQTTLKDTFADAKVKKIAIVDDAYDPPTKMELQEEGWGGFLNAFDEAAGPFSGIFTRTSDVEETREPPSFGDLRNDELIRFWNVFTSLKSVGDTSSGAFEAADRVFRNHLAVRAGKLDELRHVEQISRDALGGGEPDRLPSKVEPRILAEYDLVFLDYYLGDEVASGEGAAGMKEKARQNAKAVIQGAMKASSQSSCPLFVLISSRETGENVASFRDEAELLASKFRFLTKPEFRNDRRKAEFILGTLATQRAAADAVEGILEQWRASVEKALKEMQTSVRRLDVADYAYIQNYRLSEEKIPLLEYLTWMYNSYLGSLIEVGMSQVDKTALDPMKSAADFPPILRPMSELPHIYSDITTTQVQTVDHQGAPVKVWTGDLFVRRELVPAIANDALPSGDGTNPLAPKHPVTALLESARPSDAQASDLPPKGQVIERPDVLAVITPVCDLVPGREKVKSVILTGGTIKEFGHVLQPSNQLVVLEMPGRPRGMVERPHQIDWDHAWPHAFDLHAFDGSSIAGTDYVKVSRLREIYAAELAGSLSGSLGRVGTPVAPPFSHALAVRILSRPSGKGKAAALLKFAVETPMAWEFYRVRSKPGRSCGIDSELIWAVLKAAEAAKLANDHPAVPFLTDPEIWRPLTTPFAVEPDKFTTPGQKGLAVQRLREMPEATNIDAGEVHVLLQLVGALHQKDK